MKPYLVLIGILGFTIKAFGALPICVNTNNCDNTVCTCPLNQCGFSGCDMNLHQCITRPSAFFSGRSCTNQGVPGTCDGSGNCVTAPCVCTNFTFSSCGGAYNGVPGPPVTCLPTQRLGVRSCAPSGCGNPGTCVNDCACGSLVDFTGNPCMPPVVPPVVIPPVIPPVIPAPPPCGNGTTICGHVNAAENPLVGVRGIFLQLLDPRGNVVASTTTDNSGSYRFPGVASNYWVYPVMDRDCLAMPLRSFVSAGTQKNFTVRGLPVDVSANAPVGSFVLLSTFSITGLPPSTNTAMLHSAASGWDGLAHIKAVGGVSYWQTCWTVDASGWHKGASVRLQNTPAVPQTSFTTTCQ